MGNAPASTLSEIEWLFARDGTLTGKDAQGKWLLGNSLPMRTAKRMLRKLQCAQSVACFLDVPHAAFLKEALRKLNRNQGIVAVVPDAERLNQILHCENFSTEIGTRLWFATGEDWDQSLAEIFQNHPGLSTPSTFIRTSFTDESALQTMISRAQKVFAAENARRGQIIQENLRAGSKRTERICLFAPSMFRLWDPAALVLSEMLPGVRFDPDQPVNSAPLGLSLAVRDCDAIVAANVAQADAQGIVPEDKAWITWVTRPIIPAYTGAKRDSLLLADESWTQTARHAGWPEKQLAVAAWPQIFSRATPSRGNYLTMISDTTTVAAEPDHFELSSHALLWETIRQQLSKNPFDLREDPGQYLVRWLERCQVARDGLDIKAFIEELIIPTYQQSIVKLLSQNGLSVRCFGAGWEQIESCASHVGGKISDMDQMEEAVGGAAALIHASPMTFAHPIEGMGRVVISTACSNEKAFIADALRAARGELALPRSRGTSISAEMILARI
ncbi:MAG TPA: hypothetical protein VGG19_10895 [Tepidisphaeraceae bacterium]|jgi:hypothetical protein